MGMRTVRDGLRWHLIDRGPEYDFSSFLPMLKAAVEANVQVIWSLVHYGWPDDVDLFSAAFVDRFARYARATARVVAETNPATPFYAPINEISFSSWAASRNIIFPFAFGRDDEIKRQLIRATIAGCHAIRDVDRRARFVFPEPAIHVFPTPGQPEEIPLADAYNEAQYDAWEMIAGRRAPELGGSEDILDILGVNYYHSNQWQYGNGRLRWEDNPRDSRWIPFDRCLETVWQRYRRPLFVSETSHFGAGRAKWILEIGGKVHDALCRGIPVQGLCVYPIFDRYDWEDKTHWHNSGLWDLVQTPHGLERVINAEYGEAFQSLQAHFNEAACPD
jgi:beta-glucosidase/6-phospho-beta-glucosidase/beta-galactosidase